MSRITDYSSTQEPGQAFDQARALLVGGWSEVPDDLHSEAEGHYMIDFTVDE
jgi:hypothetical protein